ESARRDPCPRGVAFVALTWESATVSGLPQAAYYAADPGLSRRRSGHKLVVKLREFLSCHTKRSANPCGDRSAGANSVARATPRTARQMHWSQERVAETQTTDNTDRQIYLAPEVA